MESLRSFCQGPRARIVKLACPEGLQLLSVTKSAAYSLSNNFGNVCSEGSIHWNTRVGCELDKETLAVAATVSHKMARKCGTQSSLLLVTPIPITFSDRMLIFTGAF